jgi:phage repressor protein C with HTH and peptisase S24 domain
MPQILIDRINERLSSLNLSPRAASLLVGTNPDLVRGILRAGADANPTTETLAKIAQALQTTPAWLRGETEQRPPLIGMPEAIRADRAAPLRDSMPKDLPVWGSAAGSVVHNNVEGFHVFTGEPVDYVRRPPALANVRDAYAIYVTGDSMAPLHNNGDLRFVHPHRPASPGDSVILQTKNWEHDPGQGYIKIFRRRKADTIVLEQLNPAATLAVPVTVVTSMHRVMTLNDLFGV